MPIGLFTIISRDRFFTCMGSHRHRLHFSKLRILAKSWTVDNLVKGTAHRRKTLYGKARQPDYSDFNVKTGFIE